MNDSLGLPGPLSPEQMRCLGMPLDQWQPPNNPPPPGPDPFAGVPVVPWPEDDP